MASPDKEPSPVSPRDAAADPSAPTGTAPRAATPHSGRRSSSGEGVGAVSSENGRFLPGTVLTERFRIVGLLGRGGMGEVYRADDLLLGQAVALKFLPERLKDDPGRLERFYVEVRLARQITHPAVCRIHDVEHLEGQPFLAMEFVDGEDLKSLLRRIGRLPVDKGIEMGRQLAAGLAAAHERGVLHRDLKPENVMIDGRGKVRITDFGLAAVAETVERGDVRSGTPAYMSPEQLEGREVTSASDIFALGLVLYELFTGKRAYAGHTVDDVLRARGEAQVASPSELISDLDPAVDRVVMRCLDPDPARRPATALAVAAALPGGDPLAAALQAGETPSPELVAAAGRVEGVAPMRAWAAMAFALTALIAVPLASSDWRLVNLAPLEVPPSALEDRAQRILSHLRYDPAAVDSKSGILRDFDYLSHVEKTDQSATRWAGLATGRPPVFYLWHRRSPQPLIAFDTGRVQIDAPPRWLSGMTMVLTDGQGRLVEFAAVPPQVDEPATGPPVEPDWAAAFSEAGLDIARFTRDAPRWSPQTLCDTRAAWTGVYPERPELPVRVEAAGYRGRLVYFQLLGSWSRAWRMQPDTTTSGERTAAAIGGVMLVAIGALAAALARRHWRLGRCDRKGALRLGAFVFLANVAAWALRADHVASAAELGLLVFGIAPALLGASLLWVFYLAVEPYVRKHWPRRVISWTRLLAGGWKDVSVGRDVLIGACAGAAMVCLIPVQVFMSRRLGMPPARPASDFLDALMGAPQTLSAILEHVVETVGIGLGFLLLLLALRLMLRREWLAAAAVVLLMSTQSALIAGLGSWKAFPFFVLVWMIPTVLLLRFGLLTIIVALLVVTLVTDMPLTPHLGHWTGVPTLWVLGLFVAIVVWGFFASLGGRSPFSRSLLDA